ncbi:MAG TPA: hypothetical protein VK932_05125 [Kofleriaceae bacterium]|nr:hypothetical protein [Kofleriaceae bacterium]
MEPVMRPGKLPWLTALAALAAVALLALAPRGAAASPADDDGASDDPDAGDGTGEDPPAPAAAPAVPAPAIGEVLAEAYRAAGLDRSPGRGWVRRARLAGLVPSVSVRTGRNTRWQDLDPDIDRGTTIDVRATWRLDRLVFDGRELQVANIEASRRRERRQLASRVVRAYFRWQRLAAAAAAQPRHAARAAEAAAEVDAFTDGWFTGALARARRR